MKVDNEYIRRRYIESTERDKIENSVEYYTVWLEECVMFLLDKLSEESFKKEYFNLFGEVIK